MKRALPVLALVVATLAALGIRVVVEGRGALARGDRAIAEQRTADAIAAWETAARWYLPGAPHVDDAYARLTGLAAADPTSALAAWRAVRSASIATRGMWTPHADDLARADAAIAALSADRPDGAPAAGSDRAARLAFYQQRLAVASRPGGLALWLAVLGVVAWLGGTAYVVRRGLDGTGAVVRRPALVGAFLAVVGIAAWAAGLYNA